MSDKLVIASIDSPQRCQRIDRATDEQCKYVSQPGEEYCSKHMNCIQHQRKRKSLIGYKLALYSEDLQLQQSRSDIKSLGEELTLCRICTQNISNLCLIEEDLLQYTPQLSMLINMTAELAITLHQIHVTTHTLLDKGLLFDFAEAIVDRLQEPKGPLTDEQALQLTDKVMAIISEKMGAGSKVPSQTYSSSQAGRIQQSDNLDEVNGPVRTDSSTGDRRVHYRIKHWDLHLKAHYQNPDLTNLRAELAYSRILLQNTLKHCPSPATLLHNLSKIVGSLNLIKKLAHAIQIIDHQTGNLLDRGDVLSVAAAIAEQVALVTNPDDLESIVSDLEDTFQNMLPDEPLDRVSSLSEPPQSRLPSRIRIGMS